MWLINLSREAHALFPCDCVHTCIYYIVYLVEYPYVHAQWTLVFSTTQFELHMYTCMSHNSNRKTNKVKYVYYYYLAQYRCYSTCTVYIQSQNHSNTETDIYSSATTLADSHHLTRAGHIWPSLVSGHCLQKQLRYIVRTLRIPRV